MKHHVPLLLQQQHHRHIWIHLSQVPHTLLKDTSDVCLFVADLKKGKKEDHEPTLAHYRDLLERNGVTGITQIIPVRQLKVEYDQYEMKRRLCDQFDCFLSEAKVSGHVRHLLGKEFVKKRKYPTPLKLNAKDLKKEFAKAMSKTVLNLHGKGNCSVMTVGHSKMAPQQITENILTVAAGLAREYPGGWDNIRSLNIKTPKSLPIPIYLTLKSSNTLDVPEVKPKRPKAAEPMEDELSTFPGARVKVLPSGKVLVTKDENEEEDSDTELKEILQEFSSSKSKKKKGNNMKIRKKQEKKTPSRKNVRTLSTKTTVEESIDNEVDDDDGGIEEDSEDEMDIMSVSQINKEKKSPGTRATDLLSKQKKKKKKKSQVLNEENDDDNDDDDDDEEKEIEDAESAYLSQMFQQQESSNISEESKKQPSGDLQGKKKRRRKRKNNKVVLEATDEIERKKQKTVKVAAESKPKNFVKIKKKNNLNGALRRIKNKK
ncbi:ribosomal L1 domain-containing protein 1 isoform X2 [Anabrus simplex]|uniref:ribosomal L1 domain-containing protein 1 isoform X2 n=1 Tax=Anabrus simplex TaxID=316456 RepID=UPI0035A2E629